MSNQAEVDATYLPDALQPAAAEPTPVSLEDPSGLFAAWPQVKLAHIATAGGGK